MYYKSFKKIIVMKSLIVFIFVFISGVSFSQTSYNFSFLNQSENKLLDYYGIDYTGPFIRYKVVSNEYKTFKDTSLQLSFLEAFDKFQKWNKNYFKIIPDTNYFSDGTTYMKNKNANELLKFTLDDTRKILGIYSIDIDDKLNDIKTIEILELYNTGMNNYIDHIIMIEDFKGFWELVTYDEEDITLDCAQCMVP